MNFRRYFFRDCATVPHLFLQNGQLFDLFGAQGAMICWEREGSAFVKSTR
jgi:hypothetical protein